MNNEPPPAVEDFNINNIEEGAFSATQLLDRPPSEEYIKEWTKLLTQEKEEVREVKEYSILIFRLRKEWLALPILVFSQVSERRKIHHIPHRTTASLLGLVNVRGQMKLCVALHNILQIENSNSISNDTYEQMLVIEKNSDIWVFPVDEIYGIHQCNMNELQNVPVTVSKSTANFLRGMLHHDNKKIGLLDEELLFYSLKMSVL